MNISDILGDSFRYAISDYKKFLIFGIIVLLGNLYAVFQNWSLNGFILFMGSIVSLIFIFVLTGYLVNVVRNTVNNVDELPELDFGNNFVDGIKVVILNFIYYIIPSIIILLVATITGGLFASIEILSVAFEAMGNNVVDLETYLINTIPQSTFETLFISLVITLIVGIILLVIFSIFSSIAFARFSKYESLSEGLNFVEVFNDIKTIGVGKIIIWFILLVILILVIGVIMAILHLVPYIGIILGILLCQSFVEIVFYRSLGLLYRDA